MKVSPPRDLRFALVALAVFAFLALATNRWVLVGRIPLPADLLGYFPPWESANITLRQHSEIGDSLTLFYPWRVFQATSLRQAILPLWNPLILGGTPFLGEAQSALFYPIHLLHVVLPGPFAWAVTLLVNMIFTGVFTAWFARDIGGTRVGAIAAGVLFSCCGFVTAFQVFSSLADALIWLPFIFWAVRRLVSTPSIPYLMLTAAGFALCVFAGHPETAIHVTIAAVAFALWECSGLLRTGGAAAGLLWFAAAGAIALGLAFVQVIPTLEWVDYIALTPDIRWPARPVHEMFALVSRDVTQNPNSSGLFIPEAAAYVAPIALLLTPFAFLHRNRRIAVFFLVAIVVCLQVIWQTGPVHWMVSTVDLLARLKNWRVLFVLEFSLAVLAGMGLSVLCEELTAARRKYSMISCAIAFALIGIALWALPSTAAVKWYWGPISTAIFLTAGFVLILIRFLSLVSARTFAVSALAVLALDMGTFRASALPYVQLREVFPDVPLYQFLRSKEPANYRIAVVDGTSASNFSMPYGISEVGGWDVGLQLIEDFMDDFTDHGDGINLNSASVTKIEDRRLDLMNIRYVVATTVNASAENMALKPDRYSLAFSDGSVRVFENRKVLARARFLPAGPKTVEVIPDDRAQLARIKESGFDADGTVILSAMPENLSGVHDSVPSAPRSVETISQSVNESVYRIDGNEPGILQISQVFYPGWRAFVDGQEVPVLRSNFALVAVVLPKGAQIVRLVYDPASFKIGLAVTLPTLLLAIFLTVRHLLKTPKRRQVNP